MAVGSTEMGLVLVVVFLIGVVRRGFFDLKGIVDAGFDDSINGDAMMMMMMMV